ncbi:hypothetical protein DL764_007827 [Monosporascus ibericus]|uniref:Uncharacterized protein n=1 Tax=Monosporascus ibericus TaxID=155417 RepID=A0A4Q4T2I1_9PEZI|nr:hypothetical protein DL764_007827 [Monosporascus ibericus]
MRTQDRRGRFAPLDLALPDSKFQFLDLFRVLGIPSSFSNERVQSDSGNGPNVAYHRGADPLARDSPSHTPLPQADYSYLRSGFFLRTTAGAGTTLACFGASPRVRARLREFMAHPSRKDAIAEPYLLLDLIIDGLFQDVDNNVWNMRTVFGSLEHLTLTLANSRHERNIGKKMPFVALHNVAKHIVHLGEALESCLLLIDSMIAEIDAKDPSNTAASARTGSGSTATTLTSMTTTSQLRSSLLYHRSLFRSTKLRLTSLSKRVDNAINLAFNMVTQQDSMVMIQDSSSMKIIAAITMLFLPTTTVATVIGSQLFLSSVSEENWLIQTSPLFMRMWSIAVPLTLVVGLLALAWHWWMHSEEPQRVVAVARRRTGI